VKVYKDEILTLVVMLAVLVGLLWNLESGQTVVEVAQYCEMVQLYKDSGGENGWPDYNQTFSQTCLVGVDSNK
jgi:hypothetical protein